ncbi:MAG: hypothetical protein ABIT71_12175 [Vicinamibacteraceae bacterium]
MHETLGAVVLVALCIAMFWLLRRYLPTVSCPNCQSGSWIILNDMKQCRDCGRLFY